MKKLTDRKIAGILGVTPQNIFLWKKRKPLKYKAVRGYFLLKENGFFTKIKKAKAFAELTEEECGSIYAKKLAELVKEIYEAAEEINGKKQKEKNEKHIV